MKLQEISLGSIRNMAGSKKLISLIVVTGIIIGVFAFASTHLILSYRSARQIEDQKAEMQATIQKFQSHVEFLNQQKYRPIPQNKLGDVQTDLLLQAQAHTLNLVNMKTIPPDRKNPNIYGYTMTVAGSYENIIDYLKKFGSRDALLNIIQLQIEPKDGMVDASITYRVYTKGGK